MEIIVILGVIVAFMFNSKDDKHNHVEDDYVSNSNNQIHQNQIAEDIFLNSNNKTQHNHKYDDQFEEMDKEIELQKLKKQVEYERKKKQEERRKQRIYSLSLKKYQQVQQIINKNFSAYSDIENLTPREFEEFVAKIYELKGFKVEVTPPSNDGGKDIIAIKDGIKTFIECKYYSKNNSLGRPALQKLIGALEDPIKNKAVVVNTGKFTKSAIEYAKLKNIETINFKQLKEIIKEISHPENLEYLELSCFECAEIISYNYFDTNGILKCPNGHKLKLHASMFKKRD